MLILTKRKQASFLLEKELVFTESGLQVVEPSRFRVVLCEERPLHPVEEAALSWSASPSELPSVKAVFCEMQATKRLELLDPLLPPLPKP